MPRHNRRREVEAVARSAAGVTRRDDWRGEAFLVRTVPGVNAAKPYRCPGCAQAIPVGVAHLVAWPDRDVDAGERRHWHTPCWAARDRRRPG